MFPALVDSVSNHVKPYWPAEATTASDSEDLGGAERLRVETKVNVELHQENKLNHTGERERDTQQDREKQTPGNGRDTAPPIQQNSHSNHQPEQRKGRVDELWGVIKFNNVIMQFILIEIKCLCFSGILKNKINYPPPLSDKNMKNRLREKLSDYNSPTITSPPPINNNTSLQPPSSVNIISPSSRSLPLVSNDGGRPGNHDNSSLIKTPVAPRLQPAGVPPVAVYRETNGGMPMHLKSGTVNGGNDSDSE